MLFNLVIFHCYPYLLLFLQNYRLYLLLLLFGYHQIGRFKEKLKMALRSKTMSHHKNQHLSLFLIQIKWNHSNPTQLNLKPQLLQFLPQYFIIVLNHNYNYDWPLVIKCFDVPILSHPNLPSRYFHLSIHSHYLFGYSTHKILLKSC